MWDNKDYPGLRWGINQEQYEIGRLDKGSSNIDGEQQEIHRKGTIINPHHGTEQAHHVWHRTKLFCWFLLVDLVECWPAKTTKNLFIYLSERNGKWCRHGLIDVMNHKVCVCRNCSLNQERKCSEWLTWVPKPPEKIECFLHKEENKRNHYIWKKCLQTYLPVSFLYSRNSYNKYYYSCKLFYILVVRKLGN